MIWARPKRIEFVMFFTQPKLYGHFGPIEGQDIIYLTYNMLDVNPRLVEQKTNKILVHVVLHCLNVQPKTPIL